MNTMRLGSVAWAGVGRWGIPQLIGGIILLQGLSAFAQQEAFNWATNADDTITITRYIGSAESTAIPWMIDGRIVTRIGDGAFMDCDSLWDVGIPSTITYIGSSAFLNCDRIPLLTLPNSVTFIGSFAFHQSGLWSISIPASVTNIGDNAFSASYLHFVTIPDGVVANIDGSAFSGCSYLESAYVGNGIAKIPSGMFAYSGQWGGALSVQLGTNITNIGASAFRGCSSMTSIAIPDSVADIEPNAFFDCTGLASCTIGAGVTNIGDSAFSGCSNLVEAFFSGNAPILGGAGVFAGATNATVYRLAEAAGWPTVPAPWSGRPTAFWMRYSLTVDGGSGSGSYLYHSHVPIVANPPAAEMIFDRWTGDTQYVNNVVASNAAVTMPARDVALTATYRNRPYILTVNGGGGGGSYTNQQRVAISANAPAVGMAFDRWGGDTQYVDNVSASNAVVTMPAQNVNLTALYKAIYYTLTVNGGGGGGSYTNQQIITVAANDPPAGLTFDQWTGDTQYVDNVSASNAVVTMPARDVALTATYKNRPYILMVVGGGGGGSYTNQQRVAIAANPPAVGMTFDRWTGDTQYVENVVSSSTVVTMPAGNVMLTATYAPVHYTLTVSGGSGSGSYTNQQRVTITANAAAVGMTFDRWTGDTQHVANVTSSTTTVTMPAQHASLTATYKPLYYTLTINGGSGSGSYTNQQRVAIMADAPAEGMAFAWWTGATAFLDNPSSAIATVTMPAQEIALTATYRGCFSFVTNSPDANTVTITLYFGPGGDVDIPATLDGKIVTGFEIGTFQLRTNLTGITIPESVTNIGNCSFYNCTGLTNVTIGSGVATIGGGAFSGCASLENIVLPDSVIFLGDNVFSRCINLVDVSIGDRVTGIGDEAFYNCISLTNINIPDSVVALGERAFYGCSNLIAATIGGGVTNIGVSSFYNCSRLSQLAIGERVAGIGDWAFNNCISLTNITIPDSVVALGERAFYGCSNLIAATIGGGVTNIGDWAFAHCSSLAGITMPIGLASIGSCAFADCNGLNHLEIPDGVTFIGNAAFSGCMSMTNAAIGAGVTNIGYDTFGGCTSLANITIGTNVVWIGDYAFSWCDSLASVSIPDSVGLIDSYAFGDCTGLTNVALGGGVTNIESYAFRGCTSLSNLVIPDNVLSVGWYAFEQCTGLIRVAIGRGVTNVGGRVWMLCPNLIEIAVDGNNLAYSSLDGVLFNKEKTTLVFYPEGKSGSYAIPDTVNVISGWAFEFCRGLVEISIPDSVTQIGYAAFFSCDSLTNVFLPANVERIDYEAFASCPNLVSLAVDGSNAFFSSVNGILFSKDQTALVQCPGAISGHYVIPSGVTNIGSSAFHGCISLTGVTIPNGVAYVGASAFFGSGLIGVVIPDSVAYLGNWAFNFCENLTNARIGSGITEMGMGVFAACGSLTNVAIVGCITNIGHYAFNSCGFAGFVVPDGVANLGGHAFFACDNLASITIPASVTNIGFEAFAYCTNLNDVFFRENAPDLGDDDVFYGDGMATIFHLPGTTGWPAVPEEWGGRPTALWLPEAKDDGSMGVQAGKYGFNVDWAEGLTVVIEGATNLHAPVWIPLATNTFSGETYDFRDPEWTNYPGRYYRIRCEP